MQPSAATITNAGYAQPTMLAQHEHRTQMRLFPKYISSMTVVTGTVETQVQRMTQTSGEIDLTGSIDCHPSAASAHLLHNQAHRRTLVQQPQLAVGVPGVARVAIDATIQHGTMEVANQ